MKVFVVLLILTLYSSNAIPTVPGDNSLYVEGNSRYIWMPDGGGAPRLVDLHAPVDDKAVLQARNGTNNQYWLYTRNNSLSRQIIVHGNANSIWSSNYVASRPLKVIVHGWNNNGDSPMNPQITTAFLDIQDCNVIVVDWRTLANFFYPTAVAGVPSVGKQLGNFLIWLINTGGGNWNNVHLIGFSLGAHVVGNAGMWNNNSNALNATAGQYVEVIHTDGGFLGISNQVGNADFYPNRGKHPQPGCGPLDSLCSLGRALELFASSVRTNHFVGRLCPTIGDAEVSTCFGAAFNMGNGIVTKRGTGIYALRTGSHWPY